MRHKHSTSFFMFEKTTSIKKTTTLFFAVMLLMSVGIFTGCKKQANVTPAKAASVVVKQQSDYVATPFGRVLASKVHLIEQGTEIAVMNGNIKKINSTTGEILADYGVAAPTIGSTNNAGGKFSTHANSVTQIYGNDYYAYGEVPSGKSVSSFSTTWTVPSKPNNDTTQFLWNGMQSDDENTFMQPVLTWNNGEGENWTLVNWGAINGNYFHGANSSIIAPGTTITGVMTLVSAKKNAYKYSIAFSGYSSITYTETYTEPVSQVLEDFEPYVNSYTSYPPDSYVAMYDMELKYTGSSANQPITWVLGTDGPYVYTPSGLNTVVQNNGTNQTNVFFNFQ